MKKFLYAVITVSILTSIAIYSAIIFYDYKSAFSNLIENKQISFITESKNKLKINRFPLPTVEIESFKHDNFVELNKIKVSFVPLSLLKFKPQVEKLHISVVKIFVQDNVLDSTNYSKIGLLLSKYGIKVATDISNLYILDAKGNSKVVIKNISLKQNGEIEGNIDNLGKFNGSFTIDDSSELKIKLTNNDYDFYLIGKYAQFPAISSHSQGRLRIKNIAALLSQVSPYIDQNNKVIANQDVLDLNFDLNLTEELIEFKNLSINSNTINGKGDVLIDRNNRVINSINLSFSKIELPFLASGSVPSGNKYKLAKQIDFVNKILNVNIEIEKLNLSKEEQLSNIKFIGSTESDKFLIKDCSGIIDNSGEFKIGGQLTQNSYRSLFDGNIYLKHTNLSKFLMNIGVTNEEIETSTPFILTSDLRSTVIDTYIHNLELKTETFKLSGEVSKKSVGLTPRIYANLNLSTLNLDTEKYPIITPALQLAQSLLQDTNDAQYINKFIPIRTINYIGNFTITLNDLIYKGTKFNKVYFSLIAAPSQININNLHIIKDIDNIALNIGLDVSSFKPKLNVVIEDGILHDDSITPSMMLNLRNFLLKNYNMDKVILSVEGRLSELYQNTLELQDVQFQMQNNSTLLNISALRAKTLLGDIKAQGSILLEPFTLNFVYGLDSIDIVSLCNFIPKELLNNTGVMSMSGMLTTNGDTLEKLLYNLYSRSSFIIKDAKINNFSIDDFVDNFYSLDYNTANLQTDLQLALLTGQTSIDLLKGDLELSQGVLKLKQVNLKTKETTATISAAINLYSFALNIDALFLLQPLNPNRAVGGFLSKPIELNLHVLGSIFAPQKTIDFDKFIQIINTQSKSKTNSYNN